VERLIQTLKDRASFFLEKMKTLPEYWCYAMELAVASFNRTANEDLDWRTPYNAEFGETPDISCLRF